MATENRLSADLLAALAVGDTVTIESGADFSRPRHATGIVLRLTATHIVVRCTTRQGGTYQERYRRQDGLREGVGRAELVTTDADNPATRDLLRRRTRRIDTAYRQWSRRRGDVDALRELQDAVTNYLAESLAP